MSLSKTSYQISSHDRVYASVEASGVRRHGSMHVWVCICPVERARADGYGRFLHLCTDWDRYWTSPASWLSNILACNERYLSFSAYPILQTTVSKCLRFETTTPACQEYLIGMKNIIYTGLHTSMIEDERCRDSETPVNQSALL